MEIRLPSEVWRNKPLNEAEKDFYIKRWYERNLPLGKDCGYPDCCIKAFGNMPPELLKNSPVTLSDKLRFSAAHIQGKFTGFIPCHNHAQEILSGKIKLNDLIQNRRPDFPPFPNL